MDALLGRVQIDEAVDLGGHERLVAVVAHAHGLLHTRHAGPGEADPDVGLFRLQVLVEEDSLAHRAPLIAQLIE